MTTRICILGAGVAGLTAAWHLHRIARPPVDVTILEREADVGGLARSITLEGFTADFGPHRFQTRVPDVLAVMQAICGSELRVERNKKIRIVYKDKFLSYPLDAKNVLALLGAREVASIGIDYLRGRVSGALLPDPPDDYETWVEHHRGHRLYRDLFAPMARKMWGVEPRALSADVGEERVVLVGVKDIVTKLVTRGAHEAPEYQDVFYYPVNGYASLPRGLARAIEQAGGHIHLNTSPTRIALNAQSVAVATPGGEREYDYLLSTIPLPALCEVAGESLRTDSRTAARVLPFRGLRLLYMVLAQPKVSDDHMIYFPEERYPFHRLYEQKNFAPDTGRADATIICVEFPSDPGSEVWDATDDALARRTLPHLEALGLVQPGAVRAIRSVKLPLAYPRYDRGYLDAVTGILADLGRYPRVLTFGRGGLFKLNNADHAIEMGLRAAEQVVNGQGSDGRWTEYLQQFRAFTIVD